MNLESFSMRRIRFTQWSQPHAVHRKHYKMKLSINLSPREAYGKHLNTVYGHSSSTNRSARPYLCRQPCLLNQHLTVHCVRERDCPLQTSMPDKLQVQSFCHQESNSTMHKTNQTHTWERTPAVRGNRQPDCEWKMEYELLRQSWCSHIISNYTRAVSLYHKTSNQTSDRTSHWPVRFDQLPQTKSQNV